MHLQNSSKETNNDQQRPTTTKKNLGHLPNNHFYYVSCIFTKMVGSISLPNNAIQVFLVTPKSRGHLSLRVPPHLHEAPSTFTCRYHSSQCKAVAGLGLGLGSLQVSMDGGFHPSSQGKIVGKKWCVAPKK